MQILMQRLMLDQKYFLLKKHVLHKQYHKDIKSFRISCIELFRNIDQHREKIASLMGRGFDICDS
jgi:hypothetical protein